MNYMEAAFAPAEARHKQAVLADTWGHLAPKRNATYRGFIRFAAGCFGSDDINPVPLACELKSGSSELNSSPWFYDALTDLLSDWAADGRYGDEKKLPVNWPIVKEGGVYEWRGTFRNYEFDGVLFRMNLTVTGASC